MKNNKNTVLIFNDDEKVVELLKISLEEKSKLKCKTVLTLEDFWEAVTNEDYQLIISDIFLTINKEHPIEELLKDKQPTAERILFCGFTEMKNVKTELSEICDGFLTKPWTDNQLRFLIKQIQKKRNLKELLEQETQKAEQYKSSLEKTKFALNEEITGTVDSLQLIFDQQSRTLSRHCKRVAIFARQTGQKLGLDEESLEDLELAALFHDFGLSFLAEKLHTTPITYMSETDKKTYKKYPEISAKILSDIPRFKRVVEIIKYHQENVDGSGFYNMTYRTLSMETMILRVCSFYDKEERFNTNAYQNILNSMGLKRDVWFDSSCLDAFFDVVADVKKG